MLKDGIKAAVYTTGTGAVTCAAIPGNSYMLPSARYNVGDLIDYQIVDSNGNQEWGVGTVGATNTIARTTITGTLIAGVYVSGGTAISLSGVAYIGNVMHEGSADAGAAAQVATRVPFTQSLASGVWANVPSIFRLALNGTGSVIIDSMDVLGNITTGVASYTPSSAVNSIQFPYAGDSAVQIRATLTGTATAKVI